MKIKMSSLQTQRQALAPFLRQSIEILMLPLTDLSAAIDQELMENPMLEPEDHELHQRFKALDQIRQETPTPAGTEGSEEDTPLDDVRVEAPLSLEEVLTRQLHLEIADPLRRKIGEFIIGNLDEEGYFTMEPAEVAGALGIETVDAVQEVLRTIQGFEPVGTAAHDLRDRLLIQLQGREHPQTGLAARIIQDHFHQLGEKKYHAIAKALRQAVEDVQQAAALIASLSPKPVSRYNEPPANLYIQPDVFIKKDPSGELKVDINRAGIPALRVNQIYFNYLKRPGITDEEREFIRERLNNAINFIKSVQQRGETLRGIAEYIAARQHKFLEGDTSGILPMTMKEVSAHLDRNDSTISRAINDKFVDTPVGLYPLKFFFSQAVFSGENEDVSTHAIKEEIQNLVEDEDKAAPLSDLDIQTHFKAKGLKLARRTINKYRQMLNIPPSYKRKEEPGN